MRGLNLVISVYFSQSANSVGVSKLPKAPLHLMTEKKRNKAEKPLNHVCRCPTEKSYKDPQFRPFLRGSLYLIPSYGFILSTCPKLMPL